VGGAKFWFQERTSEEERKEEVKVGRCGIAKDSFIGYSFELFSFSREKEM